MHSNNDDKFLFKYKEDQIDLLGSFELEHFKYLSFEQIRDLIWTKTYA